jgi:hypothetical protein
MDTVEKIKAQAMIDSKCDYWNGGNDNCDVCGTPMRGDCWNRMCLDLVERMEKAMADTYERVGIR